MASLEIVDHLIAAGFTDKQARATTQSMERVAQEEIAELTTELATKADLYAVKADLQAMKTDIQAVKTDMYAMKADLHRTILNAVYALGGMMVTVAIAAVTIAVMVLR